MAKKKPQMTTPAAQSLADTTQQMAQEGYVALPARRVFGSRMDNAGAHWKETYNTLLGVAPDGKNASVAATSPVGNEIPVTGGTEKLGYISWGANNRHPNMVSLLVSMLPYTAVGVKFNTDVIAGLGPKPMYRYNRFVNGGVQTERIDYSAAKTLIEGQLMEKRKALMDFLATEGGDPTLRKQMEDQLRKELADAEAALKKWELTTNGIKELLKNSNVDLVNTELANDFSHFGICFPELQLDRQAENKNDATWKPRVIGINYHSAHTCRLERMDKKGVINYVYISNQWLDSTVNNQNNDFEVAAVPALDAHRPLASLEEKIRNHRIRAYNGKTTAKGKPQTERPTHFILPCYYPSAGHPYYPQPAWQSILVGDVYRYLSTIVESRRIAKENSNSAGKIIYIHVDYLTKLYFQEDAKTSEAREKLRDDMWNEINTFLQDRQNNGQTILSFTFTGTDGKEHDAWRIVDVPMNSANEADANKTELEELSNIVFLALQIHSVLIGNSIGASSSGGTQQREMYELKKLLTVPTQRLLLKPYYVARDFNGWDEHLEWEIGSMTLTTLDRNKNGIEETKV